jgi:hypothetical protein
MRISPFLPGLILALAVWILPLALRLLPEQILSPLVRRAPRLPEWVPWIHSIALPYLGLLCGWVSSRDSGLTGHTPLEWAAGVVGALALGALLGRISARYSSRRGWGDVRDETRWTLYRAAVWPLAGFLLAAVGAGLLASLAEYAWRRRPGGERPEGEAGLLFLLRAGSSAALFALAHNFLLAMLFYSAAYAASQPGFREWIKDLPNKLPKSPTQSR